MVSVVDIVNSFCLWFPSLVVLWFASSQKTFCCSYLFMVSIVGTFLFMVSVVAGKHVFMVSVAGLLVDSAAAGGSTIFECIERFLVCCVFGTGFRRWFLYGFRRGRKTLFMVSVVGLFMV